MALLPYVAVGIGLTLTSNAWVAIGLYHVGMAFALRRADWASVRRGWTRARGLAFCAVGAAAGPGILLAHAIGMPAGASIRDTLAGVGLSGAGFTSFAVYYTLVNPFLEEPYWRSRLADDRSGVAAMDVAFAGYHVFVLSHFIDLWAASLALPVLSAVAWAWRRSVRATGGLAIPVASHVAGDASVMVAAAWLCSRG